MPRLQLSNDHMRMIIFVLKECGVPDVPSLETLCRIQDGLRENGSVPTTRHETERGNIFYVNDIGAQIAKVSLGAPVTYYYMIIDVASLPMLTHTIYAYLQDFANPLVRPFIHVYPEISPSSLSEPWHFKKWAQELGPEFLTPMAIGHKKQHFYVRELAMTFNREFIIPLRWVMDHGDLCAFSWPVNTLEVRYYDFYC